MPVAGLVAGALCASVGWLVVTQGLRSARAQRDERRASEQALVADCLANVDRVIDLPALERAGVAPVIDLRTFGRRELDREIDLSAVQPRNGLPAAADPSAAHEAVTLQPPSIWRAPRTHVARSAAASA